MTKSNTSIQVLSVDSHDDSRRELKEFFETIPDLNLKAQAANASEAIAALQGQTIDVALVDLSLIGEDGIQLTKQIRQMHNGVRVLIFTASDSPDDIFSAMDAGADGYVLKNSLSKVLETAVRSVRLGAVWLDPGIAKQVLQVVQTPTTKTTRILPTGLMTVPLLPDERNILTEVASSNCVDGVCMVDPDFVRKLRRFSSGG